MLKKLPRLLLLLLSLFLLSILALLLLANLFQAKSLTEQKAVRFVIPKGQAIITIADRLEDAGLIKTKWAFRLIVYKNQLANKIQAGSFELSPSMSVTEIANTLTVGTNDVWVTLPEGWRREEIADSLSKQELTNFKREEFLTLSKGAEGQLFPDTYLVPREISSKQLFDLLVNTFNSKVDAALHKDFANNQMSLNEILTLASLVQRESANDEEMPLIAGILQNRLNSGIALQVDATLQYIKGYSKTESSWWPTPLAADKKIESLYNTYKYVGLPPAPICNPGLAAIKAALAPSSTSALYYIHDNNGKIHTASTLQGHNDNVNEYLR